VRKGIQYIDDSGMRLEERVSTGGMKTVVNGRWQLAGGAIVLGRPQPAPASGVNPRVGSLGAARLDTGLAGYGHWPVLGRW
jgi:hypothetical protein